MSPVQPFIYDAFISYSSLDRPWAERLVQSLTNLKLKVFYDRAGLEVGELWERQLDQSLGASQHLVVLWSKNSAASVYVADERSQFKFKAAGSAADPQRPTRRQVIINLDDSRDPFVYGLQTIPMLSEAKVYPGDAASVNDNLWREVVAKIERAVRDSANATRILVAVLATTRGFLDDMDFDDPLPRIGTPNELLATLGITKSDLLQRYGANRDDWCPFGGTQTVWTVLEQLKEQIVQATTGGVTIDWIPIGDDFWSANVDAAEREARRLVKELSLIVIDPLSLCDDAVRGCLDMIQDCFANNNSVVMVLTPYGMSPSVVSLRNLLRVRARPVYHGFYQPPVPPAAALANFGVNIGDGMDMQRLVLTTLGHYVKSARPQSRNPYLNQ